MQARRFPFIQLDVFSSRPLEGNQLAVFTDGRGLSDAEMQAIAREMNFSETTFILPRDSNNCIKCGEPAGGEAVERSKGDTGAKARSDSRSSESSTFSAVPVVAAEAAEGVRVRIFTIAKELPFAGHPTLGTAAVIQRATNVAEVRLQLGVDTIPVRFRNDSEGIFGEMRQRDPGFGAVHDREAVARAVGVSPETIATDLPIQTVSTGLPFTIVPLRTLDAVSHLRFQWAQVTDYLERTHGGFFYFVARETVDPAARLHARMIFYGGEDPATGSAAGCCASWAVAHGVIPSNQTCIIEQGLECSRPSRIFVCAGRNGDRIINVRVGGYSIEIARGELFL